MILELKAKHFKGTIFGNPYNCAITKAGKEHFNTKCAEGVDIFYSGNTKFKHTIYDASKFRLDKEKAKKLRYSNKVVRRMRLTLAN